MANQNFWLADIEDHSVAVSYINQGVQSIGPACPWDESNDQSFVTAVDQSLSEAANSAKLPQESEPNNIALIIPPFWIGSDGKIVSNKRKILEVMSRDLKLKPMGFIANDEAIVESANNIDNFPASFVLVNLNESVITVSLTYLGRVTERIVKNFAGTFDPEILESAIIEFKSESALPPQIILFGQVTDEIVDSVKNYSWIGKKNIETFLHFPEVKIYNHSDVTSIYTHAINSQFSPSPPVQVLPQDEIKPEVTLEPEVEVQVATSSELTEVSPEELGFADIVPEVEESNFTVPEFIPETVPEPIEPKIIKKKFSFPKITLPKIKLPLTNFFLIPIVISPLLILIPFYFSTAHLSLFLTPYEFNKTIPVTFDPQAQNIDLVKKIIPIKRQNIQIPTTLSLNTTGQKTVGDKAKGEITIFNKQDKVQSLPSGAIIIDSQGNKYTLNSNVQVPASSSNLDLGVITLGQVKVVISAADIGPEFNLAKDSTLHFKDFAESLIIAKATTAFTGGSKKQINAVAAADKTQLETKLTQAINAAVQSNLDQEISKNANIIRDATQIQKGRIDYNREVGEESDQLTGTVSSNIYIYYLDPQKKLDLLNSVLSVESDFTNSAIDPAKFNFSISSVKGFVDKITGQLTISGTSLPKVNSQQISKMIAGKSQSKAIELIRKNIPRVYNYQLQTNFKLIKMINPLPFRLQNIFIEFK